ncbi:protein peste [Diaphorina citri]|uniref:Protein peste n=1 Tax=Diaphorina citri TaxID=121845 RepID=A0A3Q0IXA4_DIACI|nr:protein peste [Diaphorina citri]
MVKNLRLWNGTLSYHYWQKPGVLRLTKVFIFNVTNPDGFMHNNEKPQLSEVGPFVYREDMQKVNIEFHDNGTVTFQHYKILEFVPELSVAPNNTRFILPNIPLLLVSLCLSFFQRNGTISEVQTIYTGHGGMENFGYMDKLNGLDHLPYWDEAPCNAIKASEGSFFPPRDLTKSDLVHVYDKDLCRIWPLRYRRDVEKDGLKAGYYTPDDEIFSPGESQPENKCYCPGQTKCPPKGLQNISPCQFDAPVFLSFPHFYKADPELLDAVEGLTPNQEKHETFFKIQPKLGVPLEAAVRVQLNLAVEESNIHVVRGFRSITFPIMWVEEGIGDLPPNIHRWIYLATSFAPNIAPILEYGFIIFGSLVLIVVFVRAYKSLVFTQENLERGREKLRRGSSFIVNGQHRLMIIRDSYSLLGNHSPETDNGSSD